MWSGFNFAQFECSQSRTNTNKKYTSWWFFWFSRCFLTFPTKMTITFRFKAILYFVLKKNIWKLMWGPEVGSFTMILIGNKIQGVYFCPHLNAAAKNTFLNRLTDPIYSKELFLRLPIKLISSHKGTVTKSLYKVSWSTENTKSQIQLYYCN